MGSYYFSLTIIWNSITKAYPNNYASCGEWQNHYYYNNYYLREAGLSYYILLRQKQNLEMDKMLHQLS